MSRPEFPPDYRLHADSEELQLLLRQRAERLHASPAGPPAGNLSVLTFRAGGDRFALEARFVSQVVEVQRIRELPGAPPFLRGITSIRAEVLPVIDLRELLGLPQRRYPAEGLQLIVAESGSRRPAFLTDACGGLRRLAEADCGGVPASFPSRTRSLARFFTPQGMLVLNGEALLNGDEILINT